MAASPADSLNVALAKWRSANLQNYSYSVQSGGLIITQCDIGADVRLTVHQGKVVSGVYLSASEGSVGIPARRAHSAIPKRCLASFLKIDVLFAQLSALAPKCPGLTVSYHARLGIPLMSDAPCLLDGAFPIRIWDFRPQ